MNCVGEGKNESEVHFGNCDSENEEIYNTRFWTGECQPKSFEGKVNNIF